MQGLPWRVHSAGVVWAGLPRIVLLPQSTSTRTTNKGGSTNLQSRTEHIQTMGDSGKDAAPGANRMAEGAGQCNLVRSIHPSTDQAPRMATYRLVPLPLSLQVSSRGNREIVTLVPVTHSWRRFRSVGQRGARRTEKLQASQNKSGALGTREGLDSRVLRESRLVRNTNTVTGELHLAISETSTDTSITRHGTVSVLSVLACTVRVLSESR